ncbi:MAG: vWA domain-containing protein [Runella sp.]
MKTSQFLSLSVFVVLVLFSSSCKNFADLMPETAAPKRIGNSQAELIRAFSGLTEEENGSACSLIFDKNEITETLCRLVKQARRGSEILFVVDKTGSMADDIDFVKSNINQIIDCLPKGCRLGGVAYGDRNADGPNWYQSYPLTEDYEAIRGFINAIRVTGGGDWPESVYDALWKALDEMKWKDCSAPDIVIVMGDAPPLTGRLTQYTEKDVLDKAKSICKDTKFYPVIVLQL